jgi:hypothetical protein
MVRADLTGIGMACTRAATDPVITDCDVRAAQEPPTWADVGACAIKVLAAHICALCVPRSLAEVGHACLHPDPP